MAATSKTMANSKSPKKKAAPSSRKFPKDRYETYKDPGTGKTHRILVRVD